MTDTRAVVIGQNDTKLIMFEAGCCMIHNTCGVAYTRRRVTFAVLMTNQEAAPGGKCQSRTAG